MGNPRWKPNVVVCAIIERDGRYLVVEEQTSDGLRLNNPAGHLDPGESLIQAVEREVLEETTRSFTPEALVGIQMSRVQVPEQTLDITFLRVAFTGQVGEPIPGRVYDSPIVATHWLTLDELRARRPMHRSPLFMRGIEDHAAGRRYPLDLLHTDPTVWGGEPDF